MSVNRMNISVSILALIAATATLSGPALAGTGDQHPHRRLSISGECNECDFSGQNLSGAVIVGAHFSDTDFSHAEMPGVQLHECNFTDSDFTGVEMPNSRFSGVNFTDTTFDSATLVDGHGERVSFRSARLSDADLSNIRIVVADFSDADLSRTVFSAAQIYQARFVNTELDRTVFRGARLQRADFTEATGRGTQFAGADLRGAIFRRVELRRADFTGAQLDYADFSGADLKGSRGLNQDQIANACGDQETELPSGLELVSCETVRTPRGSVWVADVPRPTPVPRAVPVDHLRMANEEVLAELERALANIEEASVRQALEAAVARAEAMGIDVEMTPEEVTGSMRETLEARREALAEAREAMREAEREAREHTVEHERTIVRDAAREQREIARREQREMERRERAIRGENYVFRDHSDNVQVFRTNGPGGFNWRVEILREESLGRGDELDGLPDPPEAPRPLLSDETERKGPAPDFQPRTRPERDD